MSGNTWPQATSGHKQTNTAVTSDPWSQATLKPGVLPHPIWSIRLSPGPPYGVTHRGRPASSDPLSCARAFPKNGSPSHSLRHVAPIKRRNCPLHPHNLSARLRDNDGWSASRSRDSCGEANLTAIVCHSPERNNEEGRGEGAQATSLVTCQTHRPLDKNVACYRITSRVAAGAAPVDSRRNCFAHGLRSSTFELSC